MNFRNGIGSGVQPGDGCYSDGEASLPVRMELANGPVTVSLVGYTLAYNTLDNVKSPTSGLYAELKQDLAGVGGDVNFIRTQAEARNYYEVFPDVVSVLKVQGGHIAGWGSKSLRMLDHFQMGPNLVRGFAPSGIGPRDLTNGTTNDSLGGSMYWGASLEAQTPLYFLPKEIGIKLATFVDAGSVWGYKGPTSWDQTGETVQVGLDKFSDDPLFGRCRSALGFAARPVALRLCLSDHQVLRDRTQRQPGVRPDADLPLQRRHQVLILAAASGGEVVGDERAGLPAAFPRPHGWRDRGAHRRRGSAGDV